MAVKCEIRQAIHQAALRLFSDPQRDRVTIQDLADAAGVPRATILMRVASAEELLEAVAGDIVAEQNERARRVCGAITDPATRVAIGIRLCVMRASEETEFGRFVVRHAFSPAATHAIRSANTFSTVISGISSGRFLLREDQIFSAIGGFVGVTAGAIHLVLAGVDTWQNAGSDAAEFMLASLGLLRSEARAIAREPLPPLARFYEDDGQP